MSPTAGMYSGMNGFSFVSRSMHMVWGVTVPRDVLKQLLQLTAHLEMLKLSGV